MAKQTSIQLKNLTKEYMSHGGSATFLAVDHINVEIKSGDFVTLLGPSGCGKTTILRMIAGFESISEGEILLNGACINAMTADKRDSAMVFQSYALFPHLDVYANIAYGLVNKKLDNMTIKAKVMEMVDLVGLQGMEHRMPNQLSGGQQQRVALARALVMEPAVLLFDEPLSNLDAKLRVYMRKEIRKIQRRIGLTSIYVTHDQSEAMSLSDKIIIMNKGHIEQVGTPKEIYEYPHSKFVADFIGRASFLEATVQDISSSGSTLMVEMAGNKLTVHYDGEPVTVGDKVQIVLRPEFMRVGEEGEMEAEVITSTYMGNLQEYSLKVGEAEIDAEEYNPAEKRIYEQGETVRLKIQKKILQAVKG